VQRDANSDYSLFGTFCGDDHGRLYRPNLEESLRAARRQGARERARYAEAPHDQVDMLTLREFRLPSTILGAWVVPVALFGELMHAVDVEQPI